MFLFFHLFVVFDEKMSDGTLHTEKSTFRQKRREKEKHKCISIGMIYCFLMWMLFVFVHEFMFSL